MFAVDYALLDEERGVVQTELESAVGMRDALTGFSVVTFGQLFLAVTIVRRKVGAEPEVGESVGRDCSFWVKVEMGRKRWASVAGAGPVGR